ncbi:hypothetical protein HYDPIDRAFT_81693, partial [Hydnomerulius pinastri MD-312]
CLQIYATLLSFFSVLRLDFGGRNLTGHADLIFLSVFGVFAYRDLWPLLTFTRPPGYHLTSYVWAENAILAVLAIVLPLTSPREYWPIDDTSSGKEPHPEQTASWLSLLLYSWLNPLISIAYKSHHLAAETLYPLADYDHVKALVARSSSFFDVGSSKKRTHIIFGLMKVFASEYAILVFLEFVQVFATLTNPVALEQFLKYMENGGEGATVRPTVWIVLLFLSPVVHSISYQWFTFIATRVAVHTEAILSDLIFEHALRIRNQAENSQSSTSSEGDPGHAASNQGNLIGTINNHVTTDLSNVTEAKDFLPTAVGVPLQIALCVVFLYKILGWSALVGAVAMVVLFPVPGYIGSLFQSVEVEKMKKTDARVQVVTETMTVLRMIKLFGWERKMGGRLQAQREEELSWTKKRSLLQLLNNMINFVIPIVVMLVTYSVYTLVAKQNLTASLVFSSMAVFDILQTQLHVVSWSIPRLIQGRVALDRINGFLSNNDVVSGTTGSEGDSSCVSGDSEKIGFSSAVFTWAKSNSGSQTPRQGRFMLSVDDELVFQRGELNLITGPTGSGKTSMLMALLGEMHFVPSGPSSWVNLPKHLGVAYAAQESWILNQTIRDNIIFGSAFDEARYKEVLFQCALEPDLALLEHGDLTEVGERGVTLSGGQKARITLARALYSPAQVLLLDDVLAALDVHTSQWIIQNCLRGNLVKQRTIVMATHHVSLVRDTARYVVALNSEGKVQSHGLIEPSLRGGARVLSTEQDENSLEDIPNEKNSTSDSKPSSTEGGTLTAAEEVAEGHVGWSAVLLYLVGWGGQRPLLNWGLFVVGMTLTHISKAAQSWYLGYWAEQYQESSRVNVGQNITLYTLIMWSAVILYSLSYTVNLFGSLRASKSIHMRLINKVFGATFRWLDTTPVARVITRCTQDIGTVDGPFSMSLSALIELTITMLVKLVAIVYLSPPLLVPAIFVAVIGGWCGQVYMKAELSVKRELSNAKAPLIAHLGATLAGLVSVRAFGAQELFVKEYHTRIDHYTRVARTFHALNCWVSVRLEALGALFSACLAAYLMYGHHNINPSNVGFSLNMAVSFSAFVLWWIIMFNNVEINGNLERIASYIEIEQETKSLSKASPPAYWPASGDLRVEGLSARYSSDGPEVLHSLSFHVRTGERVGIVGRTGSGKSSLTLSLLRCLLTEGEVYYDGILTSSIDLDALRSSITIIPQIPDLLNGTIRQNLDPFSQFDDVFLNSALRSAGLSELQDISDEGRLTLETPVTTGGTNLSVGQRQIIALARAMVRESKLLILDEATSAIDHRTDAAIQNTLREMKGVTQLIVAHRLQTIMDADRVMVLDAGRIVEFDSPRELLKRDGSMFRALVDASEDKDYLIAMVRD